MNAQPDAADTAPGTLPGYHRILLAVDSSDYSNRGVAEAVALAGHWGAVITGTHVFAAKMHDLRFRQMEGGLPDQFREEHELERQRDVHDDLISRGLSIITDSYLDQVERACEAATVELRRRSLEGKNYRALADEANSGRYDLLVMGARGLGAMDQNRIGTVCERVTRRSSIDTLVIKDSARALSEGPIVAAVDGSPHSYGALLTCLSLAQRWQVPLHVVAAFDPYYHYVAFNRIAGVLSEEAGKVFRFRDQEKLHEEIIDSGLAKIYAGHLKVAESVAESFGVEVNSTLLDGKPHVAVAAFVEKQKPSLLALGKLGIHADDALDIGGNTQHLLREVSCGVLLSQRVYQPPLESITEVTTSWTHEAEERMGRVPSFVRNMARLGILRYAQERGHTVITAGIVEAATAELMPGHARSAMADIVGAFDAGELHGKHGDEPALAWSEAARQLLEQRIDDPGVAVNLRRRAEKKARVEAASVVELEHIAAFLPAVSGEVGATQDFAPRWQAAALARLARAPEGFMRDLSRQRIEEYARAANLQEVTLEAAELGLAEARKTMEQSMRDKQAAGLATGTPGGKCPFSNPEGAAANPPASATTPRWEEDAVGLLGNVPAGYCRDMTVRAVEAIAVQRGCASVDTTLVRGIMGIFEAGSAETGETMPWDEEARERIAKAPEMIRGMLIREIEGYARREEKARVSSDTVAAVKARWQEQGAFHLDPNDPRAAS